MKKKYFTLFLVMFTFILFSQATKEESDKVFNETFEILSALATHSPDKAIKSADSLFEASTSSVHKFKSLSIKARAYAIKREPTVALDIYKEAEKIAATTDDYYWQGTIEISMANIYFMGGLSAEGNKCLDNVELLIKKIPDRVNQILLSINYNKVRAIQSYSQQQPDYEASFNFFYKVKYLLTELPVSTPRYYAQNVDNAFYVAELHSYLGNKDSAYYYYKSATEYSQKSDYKDPRFEKLIALGLEVTRPKGNKDSIAAMAKKVLEEAHKTNNDFLRLKAYDGLLDTNPTMMDVKKYLNEEYKAHKQEFGTKAAINQHHLKTAQTEKERFSVFVKILTGVTILLLITIFILYFLYRRRRKKEWKRYKELLKSLSEAKETKKELELNQLENNEVIVQNVPEIEEPTQFDDEKTPLLSGKSEQELLIKLNKFENSNKFLDKNISLSVLAGIINTNTRYLSYIINTNKNKTFNEYIQHLRINYIVNKLNEDPNYLQYKISTLAEETGFSSHTKFTEAFKKIVGMKPSTFIEFVQEERRNLVLKT